MEGKGSVTDKTMTRRLSIGGSKKKSSSFDLTLFDLIHFTSLSIPPIRPSIHPPPTILSIACSSTRYDINT